MGEFFFEKLALKCYLFHQQGLYPRFSFNVFRTDFKAILVYYLQ